MDEKAKRPGVASGAPQNKAGETYSQSSGLRRRFAAALRLPPLECGHRDPMQCYWVDCDGTGSLSGADASGDDLDGDYYRDTWLDRGYAERDDRGRELAAAGVRP